MSDKPPSQERYERENQTVSFRISRDKKEQLDELVDDLEIIKKEWLEDIIGEEARDYERVWEEAYS